MIVTIGGISVRVTVSGDRASGPAGSLGKQPESRLSGFTGQGDRYHLDLTIRRAGESPWSDILTHEDGRRISRIVQKIEGRFPFARIRFDFGPDSRTPEKNRTAVPILAACDTGHVSVIPHPGFLVAVDHRNGSAQAVVRVQEEWDEESSLMPVLQGVLALFAPDYGALMLHAASLVLDGDGYLCVGNSGAGKSTIAASAGPEAVLSDDGSWCRLRDGAFSLFPTPFSQIGPGPRAAGPASLKRVLFLEKGAQNRTADLSPGRAMTMLLSNHIHYFRFMCRGAAMRALSLAGELCRTLPASTLVFNRNFEPVPFFRETADEKQKAV